MKYYDFFGFLEEKILLSELGDIMDRLKNTSNGFSCIQIRNEPEIENWLIEIGFAKTDMRGLYKTSKFDEFYDEFTDKLWEYVYKDSDGGFDKELDISEELILTTKDYNNSVNDNIKDLSIKELLIKGINPFTLQNELSELEGTSAFKCVVDVDWNIQEWLKENKVVESNVRGAVYCINDSLRIDLYNQLQVLLEVEYYLYKINFIHYSLKDNESGTKKMVITTSEDKVFECLCQGLSCLDKMGFYTLWHDFEEDELKLVRKNKGDTFKEDNYSRYGTTRWYWEEVSKISYEEIISLLKLNLAEIL